MVAKIGNYQLESKYLHWFFTGNSMQGGTVFNNS